MVDSESGIAFCQESASASNLCSNTQLLDLQTQSCIASDECKIEEREFALPQACTECHSSCTLCTGPSSSDCLFETCL